MQNKILALATLLWGSLFKPVAGSVNGALILPEIKKAVAAGLGASSIVAAIIAGLNAILPDVGSLFTSPIAAAAFAMIVTQLVALLGQYSQSATGQTLTHSPSKQTAYADEPYGF